LEARAARRTDLEADIQRLTAEAAAAAALQARQAQELSEARSQAAALEERRRAAVAALERLAQQLATERAAAGEFERQTSYGLSEIERLRADNGAAAARAVAAGEERSAAEQAAATMQADLEAGRARMAGLEEEIKNLRAALEEAREQKSAREVDRARLESDRRHLEETCQSEMGMSLTELATAHFAAPAASESAAENGDDNGEPLEAPAPEAPSPLSEEIILLEGDALAEAEEQVRQMRERLEAMGPVNMMALEEYQEAAQRFEFLDLQRQDLLDSIRDTQQAIMEMDTVSRRQFEQAFEAINHNFQDTFRTLFGGGSAMMRLTEVEGDAEPGIDLVVQPPGKRLQNVLLLSGGEKALTALGLLLAIFRYQPSPFCILDEVDAPLDDTNIGRFTEMVGKMSLRTQFIVITHSKKTMEAAPVLYGVTMDEPGVSRLVSVRFHDGKLAAIA
jgi:chromosome segregation protein